MELHIKHEEFRLAHHPDKSVPVFLSYVCNGVVPLPEDGSDGAPMHFPVTWLGVPESGSYGYDFESRKKRARQAQGWKTGMPYLLVLEGPQAEDFNEGVALSGLNGKFLKEELEKAGIPLNQVMVSFGARFALPFGKKYSDGHFRVGQPYVITDIHKCEPQVVIACGAKVVKSLFNDKTKLSSIRGNVVEFSTGKYFTRDYKTLVIPTESPASFSMGYGDIEVFRSELKRAKEVVEKGHKVEEVTTDYRVIDTVKGVEDLVNELLANPPRHMAFDTEFGNDVARDEFSYTLSVQLAWGKGKAAYIKLRDQVPQPDLVIEKPVGKPRKDGTQKTKTVVIPQRTKCGIPAFSPDDEKTVWGLLHKLFLDKRIRLDGQHLRVDVQQFARNGANIDLRIVDGFDTMLVHHILKGDDSQGLDHLVRKYTPHFGAYWHDLDMWKCSKDGEGRTIFGYRDVPLDILIPYALKDADATWQVAEELEKELEAHTKLKEYYWNIATWTSLHLLDVERQGILVDEARRMEIRDQYLPVYEDLQKRLREAINWPDFEPTSKPKLAYLLFSEWEWKDKAKLKEIVPPDVKLFKLKPLYNTDKHPVQWDDILEGGQARNNTPCTKAAVLDQLAEENPQHAALLLLKHMSVLGKFLSTYLTPVVLNSFGVPEGGKGFAENIWSDGRVRTRLSMLTETGRYTSGSANLQTCLSGDHEVLTTNGWVRLDSYVGGKVAQWAPDGSITFAEPQGYTNIENTEDCYYFKTGQPHIDVVSTANHRWPLVDRGSGKFVVKTSQWLLGEGRAVSRFTVANSGILKEDKDFIGNDDLLRLIVAVQADASYQRSDRGIDFSIFKPRKIERLLQLFKSCGIEYRDYSSTVEQNSSFTSNILERARFYVKDTILNEICFKLMPDKLFDWWVLQLSSRELQVFCDELFLWDGLSTRKTEFFSKHKKNVEIAQAAFSLTGRRCIIREVHRTFNGAPTTLYIASVSNRGVSYLSNASYGKLEKPLDRVYCLTVPSSYFLTRRNGTITVTGNSPKKQEDSVLTALVYHKFGISLDEYKKRSFDGDKKKPAYAGPDRIEKPDRLDVHQFKSCMRPKEGYVFIEADFKTAELYIWAYASGDPELLAILGAGRDLHSEGTAMLLGGNDLAQRDEAIAKLKIGDREAYDKWTSGIKKDHEALRITYKSVIFGILYGRGANALSRATGFPPEKCQEIIVAVQEGFPVAWKWLQDNMDKAIRDEKLQIAGGRYRYFSGASKMSKSRQSAMRREASNCGVQGAVSFLLSQAGINFYKAKYIKKLPIDFNILLPIHDAFLFEVKIGDEDKMEKLIKICMSTGNKLPGTPYSLGVDIERYHRWGEKIKH